MSVTSEIETRSSSNSLTVHFASVTTRVPKDKDKKDGAKMAVVDPPHTMTASAKTNPPPKASQVTSTQGTNTAKGYKKKENVKPIEVVFVVEGDHVKMVPVKIGISDDSYMEIIDGLTEGQEVVSAGYKAISRELEEGKKIKKGMVVAEAGEKDKKAD